MNLHPLHRSMKRWSRISWVIHPISILSWIDLETEVISVHAPTSPDSTGDDGSDSTDGSYEIEPTEETKRPVHITVTLSLNHCFSLFVENPTPVTVPILKGRYYQDNRGAFWTGKVRLRISLNCSGEWVQLERSMVSPVTLSIPSNDLKELLSPRSQFQGSMEVTSGLNSIHLGKLPRIVCILFSHPRMENISLVELGPIVLGLMSSKEHTTLRLKRWCVQRYIKLILSRNGQKESPMDRRRHALPADW